MYEEELKNQKDNHELEEQGLSYEDVLEKIGFGRVQWIILIASGLILLMAMNEIIGIGIITISSQCDLKLNSADKGLLAGISYIGNVCSSYFWGYASDKIGRRSVIIASILATHIFTLILIFVPDFWMFVILRFFVGASISGASNIIYVYIGEFVAARYRPVVINYASLFVALSVVFVPAVAWLVLLMDWSIDVGTFLKFRPWRLLLLLYVFPGFLSLLILLYLPESPKILFAIGRCEEAYSNLNWICIKNLKGKTYNEVVHTPIKPSEVREKNASRSTSTNCSTILTKMWQETYPLFQRPLLRNFAICCTIMSSVFMSAIGMSIWFPNIENRLRMYTDSEHAMTTCDVMQETFIRRVENNTIMQCNDRIVDKTYIDFLIYGTMCIIGYAVMGVFINQFGRKVILVGFLAIAGFSGIVLIWITEPIAIVICFSLFMGLTELCTSITNGIVVDLIPTHLCGQAVCICLMIGRLSSVIAANFIGSVMTSYCILTLLLFSGYSILSAIIGILLPI